MSGRRPGSPSSDGDPERWSDARSDADLPGKLGAGFRALAASPPLPQSRHRRPVRQRAWLAFGLAAFTVVAIVTGGALAVAKVYRYLRGAPVVARPTAVASAEPRKRRAPPPARTPAEARAANDGEATLLARAFRSLRADRDPVAALALLDEHDRQFPAGQLADEASRARVEALLALGRRRDALHVLEARRDDDSGRERALLRGELRAETGRCAQALADFAGAEREAPSEIAARAVWDEATCRARLGDAVGARRDFERYLASYPSGAMARQARRWLAAAQPGD